MSPALANWIKKEQEDKIRHAELMAIKYAKEDKSYLVMIANGLAKLQLTSNEKIFFLSLARHKREGKNFTTGQRSAIAGIFYKYSAC